MTALSEWMRRAGTWIGDSFRHESPEPVASMPVTSQDSLRQLLLFGDASAADGPSLPFLDTAPLTHHVDDER
jgi:hypothetical protein